MSTPAMSVAPGLAEAGWVEPDGQTIDDLGAAGVDSVLLAEIRVLAAHATAIQSAWWCDLGGVALHRLGLGADGPEAGDVEAALVVRMVGLVVSLRRQGFSPVAIRRWLIVLSAQTEQAPDGPQWRNLWDPTKTATESGLGEGYVAMGLAPLAWAAGIPLTEAVAAWPADAAARVDLARGWQIMASMRYFTWPVVDDSYAQG